MEGIRQPLPWPGSEDHVPWAEHVFLAGGGQARHIYIDGRPLEPERPAGLTIPLVAGNPHRQRLRSALANGLASGSLNLKPMLTCPTCHAIISDVSEGNVNTKRIDMKRYRYKEEIWQGQYLYSSTADAMLS